MRSCLTALCLVAGLGAGPAALAGCGGGGEKDKAAGPVDLARTAQATAAKRTARVTAQVGVETSAVPLPIAVEGKGVAALDAPRGTLRFDLGSLLRLAGAPSGTPGDVDLRYGGPTVHVKPPRLEQLPVPGGKPWVAVRVSALARALGLPAQGLGALFALEPSAQLRTLRVLKGVKEVGKEDVDGTSTTHYRGAYRRADLVAALPAAERADAQAALAAVRDAGPASGIDDPVPVDVWVAGDGLAHKLASSAALPAQGGTPGGTLRLTYGLSDFGAALDAAPPAAGQTYDATEALGRTLRSITAAG